MRKVIYYVAASLDGFIAKKDGGIDWLYGDVDAGYGEFIAKIDTLLMGHATYKQVLSFGQWPYEGKKVFVFSSGDHKDTDKVVFAKDPIGVVKQLQKEEGGDVWVIGGEKLATALFQHRLITHLSVFIHPVLIGEGIPLTTAEVNLKLTGVKKHVKDLIELNYEVL